VLSLIFAPHSPARVGRRARDSPGQLDALGGVADDDALDRRRCSDADPPTQEQMYGRWGHESDALIVKS
jgi:hypothetical protein